MEQFAGKLDKIYELVGQIKDNIRKLGQRKLTKDQLEQFQDREMRNILELRKLHRQLYQEIEGERKKTQLENEKLDKETIFLECLEYQKNQLISNIKTFKQMKTLHFDSLKHDPLTSLSKNDNLENKNDILQELEQELNVRKQKKLKLENLVQEKEELTQYYQIKDKQFFQDLPNQLKKIQNELSPILDIFQLPQIMLPQQQQYLKNLPQPLQTIYLKLQRYEDDNRTEQYPIKLSIGQNVVKCENPLYQISQYEIKVILQEPSNLYQNCTIKDICQYLNISTEEFFRDIYPVTFIIKYYPMLNRVVIQLDRKNKLQAEDIICGLVRGDPGEQMFANPQNDEETNINRYMYFQWIQEFAHQSSKSPDLLTPIKLITQLNERILTHLQLELQLEKLKNSELPSPMPNQTLDALKGIKLKYFNKIPISQVVEQPPFWFDHFESQTIDQLLQKQGEIKLSCQNSKQNSLLVEDHELRVIKYKFLSILKRLTSGNSFVRRNNRNIQMRSIKQYSKGTNNLQSSPLLFHYAILYSKNQKFNLLKRNVRFQILKQEGSIIDKKRWFQIKRSLGLYKHCNSLNNYYNSKATPTMTEGYEGLLLSYSLHRVLESIMKDGEDRKRVKLMQK